jgi:hypothetical protein
MKFYKLELINREESYNQMFGSKPNVGVLNPNAGGPNNKLGPVQARPMPAGGMGVGGAGIGVGGKSMNGKPPQPLGIQKQKT